MASNLAPWTDQIVAHFSQKTPLTMMAQTAIEHLFAEGPLEELFGRERGSQYTREITFTALVNLMAGVVLCFYGSVRAGHDKLKDRIEGSLSAVYEKLKHVEPELCLALVRHGYDRIAPLIREMNGAAPALLPGRRVRMLDGNHLAATERRIKALRCSASAPRPGFGLVVYDPELDLPQELIPCEDAYTQERALLSAVLSLVLPGDCWIGDRNFCTLGFLTGLAERLAVFVIRQHANLPVRVLGPRVMCGRSERDDATIWEQPVEVEERRADGTIVSVRVRRVIVELDKPSRHGERQIVILTTVSELEASAIRIAAIYLARWEIEKAFNRLAMLLRSEIKPLGYPKAALFGFAVGLAAYMVLATIEAALRAQHGADRVAQELSLHSVAAEVTATHTGMMVAVPPEHWEMCAAMSRLQIAALLLALAAGVDLGQYRKVRRGPKKPPLPRTKYQGRPHVSTFRVLLGIQQE